MKNSFFSLLGALSIILLYSCNKKEDVTPGQNAQLTITQPGVQQIFHPGDTVHVVATATNDASLHGYQVCILSATTDTLFFTENHIHAATLDIHEDWVNHLNTDQDLKVIVSVDINHEGNKISKEVAIRTAP